MVRPNAAVKAEDHGQESTARGYELGHVPPCLPCKVNPVGVRLFEA